MRPGLNTSFQNWMIPSTGEIAMAVHFLAIGIELGTDEALDAESWTECSIAEATT